MKCFNKKQSLSVLCGYQSAAELLTKADLKVYAKTIITEIRKYDPDNIILMGCPHWDQDIDIVAKSPIDGVENVMYTLHFYAATHKDYLRDKLEAAVKSGLPVFVYQNVLVWRLRVMVLWLLMSIRNGSM